MMPKLIVIVVLLLSIVFVIIQVVNNQTPDASDDNDSAYGGIDNSESKGEVGQELIQSASQRAMQKTAKITM